MSPVSTSVSRRFNLFPDLLTLDPSFEIDSLEETMNSFTKKIRQFLVSEDGPTAVEYAVMLALIVIVCLTAITAVGTNANSAFDSIATELDKSVK